MNPIYHILGLRRLVVKQYTTRATIGPCLAKASSTSSPFSLQKLSVITSYSSTEILHVAHVSTRICFRTSILHGVHQSNRTPLTLPDMHLFGLQSSVQIVFVNGMIEPVEAFC